MVLGVRVHGDKVVDVDVALDDNFRSVPVPSMLGVPLVYKIMSGTGGDDSHIRSNIIVRFMSDPMDGFAPPEWQYGGQRGPAPPVVLVRKDKVPFSVQDWSVLEEFMGDWRDQCCEAEENRSAVSEQILQPGSLRDFVREQREFRPTSFLDLQFPLGSIVIAEGLSIHELNGKEGEVAQFGRERVGVRFPGRDEPVALKPERLRMVRAAEPREDPESKRQDTGESKQARKTELDRQEATVICERFVSCLGEDTFPEWGDVHLFGVGSHYHSRSQDVLGVWQGAVKHLDVKAPELIEALLKSEMKEFFEAIVHRLAEGRTPNSPYARKLIENKFAAVEWDDLL
mmetsp:Transcript_48618/g.157092  ORF Transcript_48618/g.157092 Transcript_48618/m.157092 type:complete len:342 (-) Transcript_48618:96-1121(-)